MTDCVLCLFHVPTAENNLPRYQSEPHKFVSSSHYLIWFLSYSSKTGRIRLRTSSQLWSMKSISGSFLTYAFKRNPVPNLRLKCFKPLVLLSLSTNAWHSWYLLCVKRDIGKVLQKFHFAPWWGLWFTFSNLDNVQVVSGRKVEGISYSVAHQLTLMHA